MKSEIEVNKISHRFPLFCGHSKSLMLGLIPMDLSSLYTMCGRSSLATYPPYHTNNYVLQFVDSTFGLALIAGSLIIVIIIVVLLIKNSKKKVRNR